MESKTTKFQPGVSGNPNGRPKGSKNKITILKQSLELALREQSAPQMHEVMEKAFELALEGDKVMIKTLLELHMTKGIADDVRAADKVAIQINTVEAPEIKTIIEDTSNVEETD